MTKIQLSTTPFPKKNKEKNKIPIEKTKQIIVSNIKVCSYEKYKFNKKLKIKFSKNKNLNTINNYSRKNYEMGKVKETNKSNKEHGKNQEQTNSKENEKKEKFYAKINKSLKQLHKRAKNQGYKIHGLTGLYGDCFFESLILLGYGEKVKKLRRAISYIMMQYKNYKGFFKKCPEETLYTMYKLYTTDNKQYVFDIEKNKIIEYTYDVMCQDLAVRFSWKRIPIQLVSLVLSRLLNVEIKIFSNTGDKKGHTSIKADDNKKYKKIIAIGQIDHYHYVAMSKIKENEESECLEYNDETIKRTKHIGD